MVNHPSDNDKHDNEDARIKHGPMGFWKILTKLIANAETLPAFILLINRFIGLLVEIMSNFFSFCKLNFEQSRKMYPLFLNLNPLNQNAQ